MLRTPWKTTLRPHAGTQRSTPHDALFDLVVVTKLSSRCITGSACASDTNSSATMEGNPATCARLIGSFKRKRNEISSNTATTNIRPPKRTVLARQGVVASLLNHGHNVVVAGAGAAAEPDTRIDCNEATFRMPGVGLVTLQAVAQPGCSPDEYLNRILAERGYDTARIRALGSTYHNNPSEKQVSDYDLTLLSAVRGNNIPLLRELIDQGRSLNACNKHGESIIHLACRRGLLEVLDQLVRAGAGVSVCDDLGRTPMHDACWTPEPCFELVSYLLSIDANLLRTLDVRGASPLQYIRPEHRGLWCAFLDYLKETHWQPRGHVTQDSPSDAVPALPPTSSQAQPAPAVPQSNTASPPSPPMSHSAGLTAVSPAPKQVAAPSPYDDAQGPSSSVK